jgi:hypothetical protein
MCYTVVNRDYLSDPLAQCVNYSVAFMLASVLRDHAFNSGHRDYHYAVLHGDLEVWNSKDGNTNAA